MRTCHFRSLNGPLARITLFPEKIINIIYMYLLQDFSQALSATTVFNFKLSLMNAVWGLGGTVSPPIDILGHEATRNIVF